MSLQISQSLYLSAVSPANHTVSQPKSIPNHVRITMDHLVWFLALSLVALTSGSAIKLHTGDDAHTRINGGFISGAQPHNVHIMAFRGGTGQNVIFGGGSIVSARHVLTAAHLLVGFDDYQIGYGGTNLLQLIVVHPATVLIYPNYVAATRQHDIAILGLRVGTTWDNRVNVQPIRYSTSTLVPQLNQIGTVAGFGFTFADEGFPSLTLRTTQLTTIASCAPNTPITGSHFCAISPATQPSNVCTGDGGAGLFVTDAAGRLLVRK